VAPKIQKQNTMMREALPAKLKLEVTLRYLATGDSYKTLQYIYRVRKSSISEFVPEVFNAIYEELKEYIEVKTRQKLKKNFCNLYFNFDSLLLTTCNTPPRLVKPSGCRYLYLS